MLGVGVQLRAGGGMSDAQVLKLREQRYSCKGIAMLLEIPEHQVWRCLQRNGLSGKARYQTRQRQYVGRKRTLEAAVEEYGAVTIEAGLNGGYLAHLGDEATGEERETVVQAIRAAREGA